MATKFSSNGFDRSETMNPETLPNSKMLGIWDSKWTGVGGAPHPQTTPILFLQHLF